MAKHLQRIKIPDTKPTPILPLGRIDPATGRVVFTPIPAPTPKPSPVPPIRPTDFQLRITTPTVTGGLTTPAVLPQRFPASVSPVPTTTQITIPAGATLSGLAKQYGTTVSNLMALNPQITDPNKIFAGERLTIAPAVAPVTPLPTTAPPPPTEPIITTTPAPEVGVSKIDAGKEAIKELTALGVSTDIGTIRTNWTRFGLDKRLGSWIGSAVQWRAYARYAKDELARIQAGTTEAQQQAGKIVTSVQQLKAGETMSPDGVASTDTPPPKIDLSRNDLTSIISDISTGVLKIPEIEIAKEATKLRKEREKARAAQALEQTQQILATRGMTFSGIRTEEEEKLAEESLANLSGISLELARNIISAARQEEQRRQPTIREFDNSLYAIYPDGTTTKLLEGTAQVEKATIGGKLYEKNPATGEWEMKIDDPSADIVSDMIGSAEKGYSLITYNKTTGEVLRESVISGAVSAGETITPEQWALTDRYISDVKFNLQDIPKSELGGVALALKERMKLLDVEGKTVDEVGNKVSIALKVGRKITLTDDEIRLMVMDDYEKGETYQSVIETANKSSLTPATLLRVKSIADDIYFPPAEERPAGLGVPAGGIGRLLQIWFPSIFRY